MVMKENKPCPECHTIMDLKKQHSILRGKGFTQTLRMFQPIYVPSVVQEASLENLLLTLEIRLKPCLSLQKMKNLILKTVPSLLGYIRP